MALSVQWVRERYTTRMGYVTLAAIDSMPWESKGEYARWEFKEFVEDVLDWNTDVFRVLERTEQKDPAWPEFVKEFEKAQALNLEALRSRAPQYMKLKRPVEEAVYMPSAAKESHA